MQHAPASQRTCKINDVLFFKSGGEYIIQARVRLGKIFAINVTMGSMNQAAIEKALSGLPLGEIRYFDTIGSTNDYAAYWAQHAPPDLSVVLADEQTAGRGRAGRQWLTPRGAALAISVILLPDRLNPDALSLMNGLGALAVSDALTYAYGLSPVIKWPNDVLLNGVKVAGVLPESDWVGDRLQGVVLGMGINVSRAAIPPAGLVNFPAGCVEEHVEKAVVRGRLLREILSALIVRIEHLGTPSFLEAWEARLAFRLENVQVIPSAGTPVEGRIAGLTCEGHLRLVVGMEEQVFSAGEIRLRPLPEGRVYGS